MSEVVVQLTPTAVPPHVVTLYRLLGHRLELAVTRETGACAAIVDDACQVAWTRLLRYPQMTEPALVIAWLLRVAIREVGKLVRRQARDVSLDAMLDAGGEEAIPGEAPSPDEVFARREQLATIHALPERQGSAVWLFAAGLSYGEIARLSGDSPRTVERQLAKGRARLRASAA